MAGQQEEGPSPSTAQMNTVRCPATARGSFCGNNVQLYDFFFNDFMYSQLPVKDLYKMHLIQQMKKTDLEMALLDRQIKKTDLEIEILKHKLKVGEWSQVTCVSYWNNI